jgi:Uma2 family endonuclease
MVALQVIDARTMTEAEYLALEPTEGVRYEYSRGRVYAMTGGSLRHAAIIGSTITHLSNLLRERDCTVTPGELRVQVAGRNAYRYPDVVVFCGPPDYVPGRNDTITNPLAVVEVESPSSALIDVSEKLREYTQIESLRAYILIAQDEPRAACYQREDGGATQWVYEAVTDLTGEIALPSLGCTLALAEIYRRVNWDDVNEGE